MRDEARVELEGPPAFELGARVRSVADVRNDGTFPGEVVGAHLVRKGEVGFVASIGTFLQQFYVYAVFFEETGRIVGCRARELELAEEEATP